MTSVLKPCGYIGFNGGVPGGLQTRADEVEVYAVGSAVMVRGLGVETSLQGRDGKVVACLALARSGRLVATGQVSAVGLSADVTVWDIPSGAVLHSCRLHKAKVQSLSFSPCEAFLASVGGPDDNALVLWSVQSGAAVCGAAIPASTAVAFYKTRSDRLVTCGRYSLLVWEARPPATVAEALKEKLLQIEVVAGKLASLDVQLGQTQRCFSAMQVDDADEILYAASTSGDVVTVSLPRLMLRRTGPPPAQTRGRPPLAGGRGPLSAATALALVPNGGPLLVGGAEGRVLIMPRDCPSVDVRSGMRLPILSEVRLPGGVTSLTLRAGGAAAGVTFLAGTEDGDVFQLTYSADAGLAQERLRTAPQRALADVAFPRGHAGVFATAGGSDVRLWALGARREVLRVREPGAACVCVAFSPDGGALVSGWSDGRIRAHGPQSGLPVYDILDAHQGGVTALAAPADGGRLVSGGGDGTVRVWRLGGSADLEASMKEHKAAVTGLALGNGDAECVSAAADGVCIVWDLRTFTRRASLAGQGFSAVAFHPDESQLVTAGGQQVAYWDATDGQAIRVLDEPCRLTTLAVHPGGQLLAVGGADSVIRLLDYDEGEVRATCVGHCGAVTRLVFAPEGAPTAGAARGGKSSCTGAASACAESGGACAARTDAACLVSVDDQGGIALWRIPRRLLQPAAAE